jgi:hypothetical protein
VLSGLGLMHARRTSPAAEILSGHPANGRPPVPASAPADQALAESRTWWCWQVKEAFIFRTDRGDSPAQGCHHGPFGIMTFYLPGCGACT